MSDAKSGVIAMIGACVIWGLSPIYYKLLTHVPPLELLAHRTLWSLAIFAGLLAFQGRLGALRGALGTGRALLILGFAALMISVNWFLFIFSVQIGMVRETSLGYYMFPLVTVVLAVFVLGERLGRWQWMAVGLATLGVVQLTWGLGAAPWISLVLAFTFSLYGIVKKRLGIGPVVSVTAEVALLSPLAAVWLIWVHGTEQGAFGTDLQTSLLLAFSGFITAFPLILFSRAAQKVALSTVGLLQYINPTLQFFCAVVLFGEVFTGYHAVAFGLIWVALAIYSGVSIAQDRARRKSAQTSLADPAL